MPGKTLHGIDFPGSFVKPVCNIGEKAAAGSEHAISHVGGELLFRFGKIPYLFGIF